MHGVEPTRVLGPRIRCSLLTSHAISTMDLKGIHYLHIHEIPSPRHFEASIVLLDFTDRRLVELSKRIGRIKKDTRIRRQGAPETLFEAWVVEGVYGRVGVLSALLRDQASTCEWGGGG